MGSRRARPAGLSVVPVVIGAFSTGVAIGVSGWILIGGPFIDIRHIAGFLLGTLASMMLLGHTLVKLSDRSVVRERLARRRRGPRIAEGEFLAWKPARKPGHRSPETRYDDDDDQWE